MYGEIHSPYENKKQKCNKSNKNKGHFSASFDFLNFEKAETGSCHIPAEFNIKLLRQNTTLCLYLSIPDHTVLQKQQS